MKNKLIVLVAIAMTVASGVALADTWVSSCGPAGCTYTDVDTGFSVFCDSGGHCHYVAK